jgi:hypothetical protein
VQQDEPDRRDEKRQRPQSQRGGIEDQQQGKRDHDEGGHGREPVEEVPGQDRVHHVRVNSTQRKLRVAGHRSDVAAPARHPGEKGQFSLELILEVHHREAIVGRLPDRAGRIVLEGLP